MTIFWLKIGEEVHGPMSGDRLKELEAAGKLHDEYLVSNNGQDWVKVASFQQTVAGMPLETPGQDDDLFFSNEPARRPASDPSSDEFGLVNSESTTEPAAENFEGIDFDINDGSLEELLIETAETQHCPLCQAEIRSPEDSCTACKFNIRSNTCPSCHNNMGPLEIVCLECGHDLRTGRITSSRRSHASQLLLDQVSLTTRVFVFRKQLFSSVVRALDEDGDTVFVAKRTRKVWYRFHDYTVTFRRAADEAAFFALKSDARGVKLQDLSDSTGIIHIDAPWVLQNVPLPLQLVARGGMLLGACAAASLGVEILARLSVFMLALAFAPIKPRQEDVLVKWKGDVVARHEPTRWQLSFYFIAFYGIFLVAIATATLIDDVASAFDQPSGVFKGVVILLCICVFGALAFLAARMRANVLAFLKTHFNRWQRFLTVYAKRLIARCKRFVSTYYPPLDRLAFEIMKRIRVLRVVYFRIGEEEVAELVHLPLYGYALHCSNSLDDPSVCVAISMAHVFHHEKIAPWYELE